MAKIEITASGDENELSLIRNGGSALRALCRKEVDAFEEVLRQHPHYSEGLARFERFAIEGFLYQKVRGHIDETPDKGDSADRRQDVQT